MRWLITNRNQDGTGFGGDFAPSLPNAPSLTYWSFDPSQTPNADITLRASWTQMTSDDFLKALAAIACNYPDPVATPTAEQKHVSMFIHGFNNPWLQTVARYDAVAKCLFDGPDGLGELISFDWPSKGNLLAYLPDRADARRTGDDLTSVLAMLYDWLANQQIAAANNPANACRARTSIIAHSMGNYALEYAMNAVWTRKNRPLLVSMLQEVLMVAADVDNDLFRSGDSVTHGDGEGLANLSYRITALYTGRDDVLGASAGLKHFGKRRLGRSGLDKTCPVPDNVWDVDCSKLLDPSVNGINIHGEYFNPSEKSCYELMRGILSGFDRSVLIGQGTVPQAISRTQIVQSGS